MPSIRASAADDRVASFRRLFCLDEAHLVALCVLEFQEVDRFHAGIELRKAPFIEGEADALLDGNGEVVRALEADIQVSFDLFSVEQLLAGAAFYPEALLLFFGLPDLFLDVDLFVRFLFLFFLFK